MGPDRRPDDDAVAVVAENADVVSRIAAKLDDGGVTVSISSCCFPKLAESAAIRS